MGRNAGANSNFKKGQVKAHARRRDRHQLVVLARAYLPILFLRIIFFIFIFLVVTFV